ncbi:MAG TPA: DUF2786 domain-containing protein [Acidimicrobiales bacterium]|nr:DUF2786 domain-containing protein [Acidimicrobiales bacterium]
MSIDTRRSAVARRIEALLAKAASTEFSDEAEACAAKAQELMARHAIDEAMLRPPGTVGADEVVIRTIYAARPYASARSALLGAIASNNHCRLILHDTSTSGRRCTLIGHATDVRYVESLFPVLSVHATRALFDADPGVRPKSYRHGFLLAYAARIGERLRAASETARGEAEQESGRSLGLVLVERWSAVDRVVRTEFPFLWHSRRQVSSSAGFPGGRAAADRAPLAHRPIGVRPGLPRGMQ